MDSCTTIANNTRDIIVHLSRKNDHSAKLLAGSVRADLNAILSSDSDAAGTLKRQAQQTLYAIEEVLVLIDQRDIQGAWEAARDASKEWRLVAQSRE